MENPYVQSKSAVPTLSRTGYVTEGKLMAKKLFDYYILSLYSQSTTYYGNITSLAYTLYKGGEDINVFMTYIERTLSAFYGRYFEKVIIRVREVSGTLETRAEIEVGLVLGDGVKEFTLDSAINVEEGVVSLSNYGTEDLGEYGDG